MEQKTITQLLSDLETVNRKIIFLETQIGDLHMEQQDIEDQIKTNAQTWTPLPAHLVPDFRHACNILDGNNAVEIHIPLNGSESQFLIHPTIDPIKYGMSRDVHVVCKKSPNSNQIEITST